MHSKRNAAILAALPLALAAAGALAQQLTHVPAANPKIGGVTLPTILSPQLAQIARAQGSMRVENPMGLFGFYGYLTDQSSMLPALGSNVEATKTEPDQNTYLVL